MSSITLRAAEEGDYDTLKTWFEDPANNVYFTSDLRNIAEYKKMFYLMALRDRKNAYYMIESVPDGTPLGFIALIEIDHGDRIGQIWYVLGEKARRGGGIMTEAVQQLFRKAKNELGLHTIYGWLVHDNVASIRVLEKTGFSRIGVQREAYYDGEQFKDRILYDVVL